MKTKKIRKDRKNKDEELVSKIIESDEKLEDKLRLIQLLRALESEDIDRGVYSIFEGDFENCIHLNRKDRKWQVYGIVRNQKAPFQDFDNLKDAVEDFISRVTSDNEIKDRMRTSLEYTINPGIDSVDKFDSLQPKVYRR